ncbi:unnamed protein product, partial [Rotaria magnacalcarata]
DDDNGTKSNNNPDDLVNEWKIPIWNNCALDDKVNLYSVQHQIYFTFTTMAADNLAAHEVGGFQQSFSSGYICRRCLITYENRLIPLTDVHFVRRAANQHQRVLQSLENNPQ